MSNNNNNTYESLSNNDKTVNYITKRSEKNSLRLRLSRVFSASGLRSPENSSPPSNKNLSWQQLSNDDDDDDESLNVLIFPQSPIIR